MQLHWNISVLVWISHVRQGFKPLAHLHLKDLSEFNILYKCVFFKLYQKLHEYSCVWNITLTFQNWILRSKTCYHMEIHFSSTPPNTSHPAIVLLYLLLHLDGVEPKLEGGEHLHPIVGHQVLPQVEHSSVPSFASSSIVPAWHLVALNAELFAPDDFRRIWC